MLFYKKIMDAVTNAAAVVAGICMVCMMVHVTADVIFRAALNAPLGGTILFVTTYYMVAIVCLPLALAERMEQHIVVDAVTGWLSPAIVRHLSGWIYLVTAAIFGVSAYATLQDAMSKYARGTFVIEENLVVPTWPGYFALPVGFALLTLYLLLRFWAYVAGRPLAENADV
jgi:TRAP-type C4-dicarboxylate transport system permease small subunit